MRDLKLAPSGSKHWALLEDFQRGDIVVPEGFRFDGASIPRGLWSLVGHPLNGKHIKAAVVHDYLYFLGGDKEDKIFADKMFLRHLKQNGVSKTRRMLMYWAVKYFGSGSFRWRVK